MGETLIAVIGLVATLLAGLGSSMLTSYYGPRWAARFAEARDYERERPVRALLESMLKTSAPIRSEERLVEVTGLEPETLARILVQMEARGVRMENGARGWALLSRKPLPAD